MSRTKRLTCAVLVAGIGVFGLGISSALAGGFGVSFGYSSGPSYAYGGYYSPVVVTTPAYYGGCATYVRHGDYYAYPTGRMYVASSCARPVVYYPPPAPVYYGGRSIHVGGFYHSGPRHVSRAVRSYGHRSYASRRVYVAPPPVRRAPVIGPSHHRGGWSRSSPSFTAPRPVRHRR
jgi:hypothetical protein